MNKRLKLTPLKFFRLMVGIDMVLKNVSIKQMHEIIDMYKKQLPKQKKTNKK